MPNGQIMDFLEDLHDPREDNKWHKLIDIVVITIAASICGADKWDDVEIFGNAKEAWLRSFLELPHGIPGSETYRRLFVRLDSEEFNKRFFDWVAAINPKQTGETIAIDGKTLCSSHDSVNGISAIHMVSAYARKAGLALGQIKVDDKSNEITAIPVLLDQLDIEGCTVTIDAMGTQKKIAKKIIDKGGDYVLALKGNQETLHQDVADYFVGSSREDLSKDPFDYHKTLDKDHGRIESREYWVTGDIAWLTQKTEWKNLRTLAMVKSQRSVGNKVTNETWYYISSLPPDAKNIGEAIRGHWSIENSLHWILDVAFREDDCRKRRDNSPQNFAVLRHITLNLLKKETTCKRSIAGKRLLAGWDTAYLEKVLSISK
jgi:predicted transposase YbfD/YdcC